MGRIGKIRRESLIASDVPTHGSSTIRIGKQATKMRTDVWIAIHQSDIADDRLIEKQPHEVIGLRQRVAHHHELAGSEKFARHRPLRSDRFVVEERGFGPGRRDENGTLSTRRSSPRSPTTGTYSEFKPYVSPPS